MSSAFSKNVEVGSYQKMAIFLSDEYLVKSLLM